MWTSVVVYQILIALLCLPLSDRVALASLNVVENDHQDTDVLDVLIGYANQAGLLSLQSRTNTSIQQGLGLARINAVKATLNRTQIETLLDDPNVLYVEPDGRVQMLGEIRPYGVDAQKANGALPPIPPDSVSGACNDPNSFKVGILDSGLDVSHPDVPCLPVDDPNTNCIGASFGIGKSAVWHKPSDEHGTHVLGSIGATRNNNLGVTGVLNNDHVCYVVARVFAGMSDASLSDLLNAVEWVVQKGAKVINLSLGSPQKSKASRQMFREIRSQGVLPIAAAGNDGTSRYMYPASYASVMSIAAIDEGLNRAYFSQQNDQITFAAPGVNVLSTVPLGMGSIASVSVQGTQDSYSGDHVARSPVPLASNDVTGPLVACPNFGSSTCPGNGGHVCLIERGGQITMEDKAMNCQRSKGVAALIWNNQNGALTETTLSNPTSVTIPVTGLSKADGSELMAQHLGTSVTLTSQRGYHFMDGTSFSSPYVAGAAAAVWQSCPDCSGDEVESCLQSTARDLGDPGRDSKYGYGLVQVEDAYACLTDNIGCCTAAVSPTPAPTSVPTPQPSAFPTGTPSKTIETEKPTDAPTNEPTDALVIDLKPPSLAPTPTPTGAPLVVCNICGDGKVVGNPEATINDPISFQNVACGELQARGENRVYTSNECRAIRLFVTVSCECRDPASPTAVPVSTPAPSVLATPAPSVLMTPAPSVLATPAPSVLATPAPSSSSSSALPTLSTAPAIDLAPVSGQVTIDLLNVTSRMGPGIIEIYEQQTAAFFQNHLGNGDAPVLNVTSTLVEQALFYRRLRHYRRRMQESENVGPLRTRVEVQGKIPGTEATELDGALFQLVETFPEELVSMLRNVSRIQSFFYFGSVEKVQPVNDEASQTENPTSRAPSGTPQPFSPQPAAPQVSPQPTKPQVTPIISQPQEGSSASRAGTLLLLSVIVPLIVIY